MAHVSSARPACSLPCRRQLTAHEQPGTRTLPLNQQPTWVVLQSGQAPHQVGQVLPAEAARRLGVGQPRLHLGRDRGQQGLRGGGRGRLGEAGGAGLSCCQSCQAQCKAHGKTARDQAPLSSPCSLPPFLLQLALCSACTGGQSRRVASAHAVLLRFWGEKSRSVRSAWPTSACRDIGRRGAGSVGGERSGTCRGQQGIPVCSTVQLTASQAPAHKA